MAVISWGDVLAALQQRFESVSDVEAMDDLAQLWGLCDRADQFAQLPLSSEDIDPVHASRQLRYHDILNTVVARLTAEGVLNTDSLHARGTYARRQAQRWRGTGALYVAQPQCTRSDGPP